MDNPQAEAAKNPATAAPEGAGTPQIDVETVTLDQLDNFFEHGKGELPVKSDGKESGKEKAASPTAKSAEPPKKEDPKKEEPAKAGDTPPAGEEVVETRSQEEIDADVETAIQKAKDEGGDEDAQNAAAEAARQPKAKVEEPPPAAKKEPEKEPEEKSRRFRIKDPIAQAALDLYKTFENTDTPITLAEAERRVRGGDAPKKEEPAAVEPDLRTVVSTLEGEVNDLKSKLEAAGGDEALYTKEIAQWTVELAEKTADLKQAKRDLRDAEADAQAEAEDAQATWKTNVDKSRARAIEAYPSVADETSPLGEAVGKRIAEMRDKSHPDHNLLFSASCPEIITRTVADELGIAAVKKAKEPEKKEVPAAKKTEAPPKSKKVEPASGAKSAAGSAPTPEDAKKRVEYLKTEGTLEELDEVFTQGKDPLTQLASRAA